MTSRTTLRDLVDRTLRNEHNIGIEAFIAAHRSEGSTWKETAAALADLTAGAVTVSWETLRQWSLREVAA